MESITDTHVDWPTWHEVLRVLSMEDYNTRVVMLGAVLLGIASGLIGTFMLLRKRALMGDAVSHSTLPGIGIAFLVMTAHGGSGRWLPGLLIGAFVFGLLGMAAVLTIRSQTRLKEDAALGIVLSVFFGLGIAVLGLVQQQTQGHAAGLESFIYGKTASMLARDAVLIAGVAGIIAVFCTVYFKEFSLICFDQDYAQAQGWSVPFLDVVMMALVVTVTVIGLQAVGLILMIALLIIPPAAARFWTNQLSHMVLLSALIGGISCYVGGAFSALLPRLPAGAIIVVVGGVIFLVSMIFGTARGVLRRLVEHLTLTRQVGWQHLLRAIYEWNESRAPDGPLSPGTLAEPMPMSALTAARSWSGGRLRRVLGRAQRAGAVKLIPGGSAQLTEEGFHEARRVVRNHRLWETYLITHADIAPVHVDSSADEIEHVLGEAMVARLEELLAREHPELAVPPSPHVTG
jgi:manganese/zinc/iron transport system permease protein